MTPPTTKLTAEHIVALEELVAAQCNGHHDCKVPHSTLAEILELARSLESGEAVVIERAEICSLRAELRKATNKQTAYPEDHMRTAKRIISGWLVSDTPKERLSGGGTP